MNTFPPPSAADLLHAAAGKLRANAKGASGGTFDVEITDGAVYVVTIDGQRTAATGRADDPVAVANGLYVASWPTEAALALADWLDAAADRGDLHETGDALALVKRLLYGMPSLDEYEAAHSG